MVDLYQVKIFTLIDLEVDHIYNLGEASKEIVYVNESTN